MGPDAGQYIGIADDSLFLVDYDGMFVTAIHGEQAGYIGSPDFCFSGL